MSALYRFAWFRDFFASLNELISLAMPENWDYPTNPTGGKPVLFNYIHHTFAKIESEKKIEIQNNYAIFNTGLVTPNQETIYAYFEKNKKPNAQTLWYFIGYRKGSDRDLTKFSQLPDVANYFDNPADLIYDTRLELRINVDHIINDNKIRFPSALSVFDDYQLSILLQGTINDAKNRVRRNYKTAIPQYFSNKLQLLLPICLTSKAKADLALVVEKENGIYRAATCLTLDMAINNARLIAKPDDEWLRP